MNIMISDHPYRNTGERFADKEHDALLRKIANGDRLAYQQLFDQCLPRLTRYLRPLTQGSNIDCLDVIQDIFLVVWEKRESFFLIKSVEQYLYRMARNRFLDLLRKEKRQDQLLTQYISFKDDVASIPHDDLVYKQFHEKACEAIMKLSPRLKHVFLMSTHEDMSIDQIAHTLGLKKDTVKKRLWMANTQIKAYLKIHADWLLIIFLYFF